MSTYQVFRIHRFAVTLRPTAAYAFPLQDFTMEGVHVVGVGPGGLWGTDIALPQSGSGQAQKGGLRDEVPEAEAKM